MRSRERTHPSCTTRRTLLRSVALTNLTGTGADGVREGSRVIGLLTAVFLVGAAGEVRRAKRRT